MPSRRDDRVYSPTGKRGASSKAFSGMVSHYGLSEGVRIYHAKKADLRKGRKR